MPFVEKTWSDRISEYPNRRLLTKEDGTTEVVLVSREEGVVSQEGDPFNAQNMTDLENRISAGFQSVEQSLAIYMQIVSFDAETGQIVTKSAGYEG